MTSTGGIRKYFQQLILELGKIPNIKIFLNKNDVASMKQFDSNCKSIRVYTKKDLHKVDLIHHTYYLPFFCTRHFGIPCVSTIHDMIPEVEGYRLWNPHLFKKNYANKSSGIIFVSNVTKQFFEEIYCFQNKPTRTIYHGVTPSVVIKNEDISPNIFSIADKEFLIYVGKRKGYKNGDTLLEIFNRELNLQHLNLIFVGGEKISFFEKYFKYRKIIKSGKVIFLRDVKDLELRFLYQKAFAHIITSKHEGFGLTYLEAMTEGTPIISIQNQISEELFKNSIINLNNLSAFEIEIALSKIMNKEKKEKIVSDGKSLAQNLTWNRCAQDTFNFYESIIYGG